MVLIGTVGSPIAALYKLWFWRHPFFLMKYVWNRVLKKKNVSQFYIIRLMHDVDLTMVKERGGTRAAKQRRQIKDRSRSTHVRHVGVSSSELSGRPALPAGILFRPYRTCAVHVHACMHTLSSSIYTLLLPASFVISVTNHLHACKHSRRLTTDRSDTSHFTLVEIVAAASS